MALGADIGYIRVSSADQNTIRQLADTRLDKVFEDHLSGNCRNRPGLDACLNYLREGDTLHVHSIDRLARTPPPAAYRCPYSQGRHRRLPQGEYEVLP